MIKESKALAAAIKELNDKVKAQMNPIGELQHALQDTSLPLSEAELNQALEKAATQFDVKKVRRTVEQKAKVSRVIESLEAKKTKSQKPLVYIFWQILGGMSVRTSILSRTAVPKADVADSLLIFVCSPDDAEVAVGDLLESYDKIAVRRSKTISNIWFAWELSLLFVAKARKRLVKAMLGPLLDKFFKPNL